MKPYAQLEAYYEALCGQLGEEPANVALAWLLHNKVVTAPMIGPHTMAQLDGSLRALESNSTRKLFADWMKSSPAQEVLRLKRTLGSCRQDRQRGQVKPVRTACLPPIFLSP